METSTLIEHFVLAVCDPGRWKGVDRLVRLGLLTRQESPTDRRVKLVGPTEHGLQLAWDQIAIHRATIDQVVARLPDALRNDLCEVITAVLESGAVHRVAAYPPAPSGDNS